MKVVICTRDSTKVLKASLSLAANLDTSLSNKGQHQDEHDMFEKSVLKSFTKNKAFKTRHKLKAHTSKIVSSFKPPSMSCMLVKEFRVSTFDIYNYSKFVIFYIKV